MAFGIRECLKHLPLWFAAGVISTLTQVAHSETVTFRVRELGRVRAELHTKRDFPGIDLHQEYFQGRVTFTSHLLPLAASKYKGTLTLTFPGKATGSEGRRQRLYTVKVTAKGVKISSVPRSYLPPASCAETHESGIEEKRPVVLESTSVEAREVVKVITFNAYTDPEWQSIYGGNSSAEVANAINVAESIYNRQLGIRLKVLSITHLSSRFANSSPSDLLNEFRVSPDAQGDATLKSLFTGKDMDGGTVGIAYVGVVCYAPQYSFSVTQSYRTLTGAIFAHEVGHNLGASHDFTSPDSLMYPSISYNQAGFSSKSLQEVRTHLNYFGDCLDTESMTPLLSGAKLTITKGKRSITIKLRSALGTPLDNSLVRYTVNKKSYRRATSALGLITIPIKRKGIVTVRASAVNDTTIKARLKTRF